MIQPNELRIGNIIGLQQANLDEAIANRGTDNPLTITLCPAKVLTIAEDGIVANCKHGIIRLKPEQMFGIPLTEQTLFELAFEKNISRLIKNRLFTGVEYTFQYRSIQIKFMGEISFSTNLHFIHQFQNFFFSIENCELETSNLKLF